MAGGNSLLAGQSSSSSSSKRGLLRPSGGSRTPSFLLVGLVVVSVILGLNYWNLSGRNAELESQVSELEDRMRLAAVGKTAFERRNAELEAKVRTNQDNLQNLERGTKKRDEELMDLSLQLSNSNKDSEILRNELEEIKAKLNLCEESNNKQHEEMMQIKDKNEQQEEDLRQAHEDLEEAHKEHAKLREDVKNLQQEVDSLLAEQRSNKLAPTNPPIGNSNQQLFNNQQPQQPASNLQTNNLNRPPVNNNLPNINPPAGNLLQNNQPDNTFVGNENNLAKSDNQELDNNVPGINNAALGNNQPFGDNKSLVNNQANPLDQKPANGFPSENGMPLKDEAANNGQLPNGILQHQQQPPLNVAPAADRLTTTPLPRQDFGEEKAKGSNEDTENEENNIPLPLDIKPVKPPSVDEADDKSAVVLVDDQHSAPSDRQEDDDRIPAIDNENQIPPMDREEDENRMPPVDDHEPDDETGHDNIGNDGADNNGMMGNGDDGQINDNGGDEFVGNDDVKVDDGDGEGLNGNVEDQDGDENGLHRDKEEEVAPGALANFFHRQADERKKQIFPPEADDEHDGIGKL